MGRRPRRRAPAPAPMRRTSRRPSAASHRERPITSGSSRRAMPAASRAPTRTFTTQSPPTRGDRRRRHRLARRPRRWAASLNPNGRSTSWYVEYGTTTKYGSRTSTRSAGSGTATQAVVAGVANLQPGVTYHFRLVASSSLGTTRGADATFVTSGAPTVSTGPDQLRHPDADLGAGHRHREPPRPSDDLVVRVRAYARLRLQNGRAPRSAARPTSPSAHGSGPHTRRALALPRRGTQLRPGRAPDPTPRSRHRRVRSIRSVVPCAARSSARRPPTCSAGQGVVT